MSVYFLLSRRERASSIALLRLGQLEAHLKAVGLTTLGDVLKHDAVGRKGFREISGIGPVEERQLKACLSRLMHCIDENGDVAWENYHQAIGMPVSILSPDGTDQDESLESQTPDRARYEVATLVPAHEITSGDEFIASFPEVIEAVVKSRSNAADRTILLERLTRQLGERKTLDQIAASQPVAVTRERIRQRELKLLSQLAEALVHGWSRGLDVQFQPSFTRYWKKAAEQFGDQEAISFTRFVEGLEGAWGVPAEQIFAHLPFITSVLTRKAVFPEPLRAQMRRDNRVYRKLSIADSSIPLTTLHLGRSIDDLAARGIETVGALFEAERKGLGFGNAGSSARSVGKVLSALTDALDSEGRIDWCKYDQKLGLSRLPLQLPSSPEEFIGSLVDVVASVISANNYTLRSLDIFHLRIAVPRDGRPTLADMAVRLETHGSTIKREESALLSALNELLIARDMSYSAVAISSEYLDYWTQADRAYQKCSGDFQSFCMLMATEWQLEPLQMAKGAEILWAVLNRYPGGRPPKNKKQDQAMVSGQVMAETVGVVVLRGFRKVH